MLIGQIITDGIEIQWNEEVELIEPITLCIPIRLDIDDTFPDFEVGIIYNATSTTSSIERYNPDLQARIIGTCLVSFAL